MRLSIVTSHPIQYYAPWFRTIAAQPDIELTVHYLWDFGVTEKKDVDFGESFQWDIPLLDGYNHVFVPNVSKSPGTSSFDGLNNPDLEDSLEEAKPHAVLFMLYRYRATLPVILNWKNPNVPLLFRGDSHRLIPNKGFGEILRRFLIGRIFRRFSACLYVGDANKDYFRYHHVPEEKLFFAPHAVDNERFMSARETMQAEADAFRHSLDIPLDARVLLFVGKFIEKKRPVDLLHAFRNASVKGSYLIFVGSGPQEKELRAIGGNDPSVRFAPFQNQSQMPRTLLSGDFVGLPSYGSGETWGLIVNEAMCLGRPAIVSDHVGCGRDLIRHGRTGFVTPAGDRASLAATIRAALTMPEEKLAAMRAEAIEHITQYSYTEATAGLRRALEAVCK